MAQRSRPTVTPAQRKMLELVRLDGDPWSHWDRMTQLFSRFERTLKSLKDRELIQDGRHIGEDGQTISGDPWKLTDAGIVALNDCKACEVRAGGRTSAAPSRTSARRPSS